MDFPEKMQEDKFNSVFTEKVSCVQGFERCVEVYTSRKITDPETGPLDLDPGITSLSDAGQISLFIFLAVELGQYLQLHWRFCY